MTTFEHGPENLLLEVGTETGGLPNLIENPNGEKGAWGFDTPVPNTQLSGVVLTGDVYALQFTNADKTATYFTSEFLPAIPGRYYAGRYDVPQTGTGSGIYSKVRFEWYDSERALISSSEQTALEGGVVGTYYIYGQQAPSGTAFVKMRWDFYTLAGGNPDGVGTRYMNKVMLTYADDANAVGSTHYNLVPNPSFEVDTTGWTARNNTTMARVTGIAGSIGTACMRLTSGGTTTHVSATTATGTAGIPVTPGKTYSFTMRVHSPTVSRQAIMHYQTFDSAGTLKSSGQSQGTGFRQTVVGEWVTVTGYVTTPSDVAYIAVIPFIENVEGPWPWPNLDDGEIHYVDAVMMDETAFYQDMEYFDGSFTDTTYIDYSWLGTAHNSASKVVVTPEPFDYSEPRAWLDILGPTHEIGIARKALDVGLLNATILDATLDPAVADTIRPGRKIRCRALVNGSWEHLYEGTITNAYVTYPRDKTAGAAVETRISITASDAIAALASQGASSGIESIPDLPYILEGKGVPWNINGDMNQINNAVVVSYNENASVLDQIAITRDSNRGYAWVDRFNTLKVFDAVEMPAVPVATFSDTASPSYSSIDVDFNIESCINYVTVKWLRYNIGSGSTEEISYGPYENGISIAEWGPRSATFTIHGQTEDANAIRAYAQAVLDANSTPVIRANSLTMPVRNLTEMGIAVRLDLYDLVGVQYDTKVDTSYRVTGLTHHIKPDRWTVDLSFEIDGSVAAPTYVPSPPFKGVTNTSDNNPVGTILMWPTATAPTGYLICNGATFDDTIYPDLEKVLGTTTLPDFTNRFPRGGSPLTTGGSSTIAEGNLPAHDHPMPHTHGPGTLATDDPGHHTHPIRRSDGTGNHADNVAQGNNVNAANPTTNNGGAHTHAVTTGVTDQPSTPNTGNAGSGNAYWQPFLGINFIIKASG